METRELGCREWNEIDVLQASLALIWHRVPGDETFNLQDRLGEGPSLIFVEMFQPPLIPSPDELFVKC